MPLTDPLARISATLELMAAQLEKIEHQLDRVVYRDTFELEKERMVHALDDIRADHYELEKRLDLERDRRSTSFRWAAGLSVPLFWGVLDDIARLFTH